VASALILKLSCEDLLKQSTGINVAQECGILRVAFSRGIFIWHKEKYFKTLPLSDVNFLSNNYLAHVLVGT